MTTVGDDSAFDRLAPSRRDVVKAGAAAAISTVL